MLVRRLVYTGLILVLGAAVSVAMTVFVVPVLALGAGVSWPFLLDPALLAVLSTAPGVIVVTFGLVTIWRARSSAAPALLATSLVLAAAAISIIALF